MSSIGPFGGVLTPSPFSTRPSRTTRSSISAPRPSSVHSVSKISRPSSITACHSGDSSAARYASRSFHQKAAKPSNGAARRRRPRACRGDHGVLHVALHTGHGHAERGVLVRPPGDPSPRDRGPSGTARTTPPCARPLLLSPTSRRPSPSLFSAASSACSTGPRPAAGSSNSTRSIPASRYCSSVPGSVGAPRDDDGHRAALLRRAAAQLGDLIEQPVVREREPSVAERQDAVEHRRTEAADEHRRVRALRGLRPRPDAVERDVRARRRSPRPGSRSPSSPRRTPPYGRTGVRGSVPWFSISSRFHPAPTPTSTRPPDMWSMLAISFAVTIGSRCAMRQMPLPTRRDVVAIAAAVSATNTS